MVVSDTPDLGRYESASLGLDRDILLTEERIRENWCFLTDLLNALQLPADLTKSGSSLDRLDHGFYKSAGHEVEGGRSEKAQEELPVVELPRNPAPAFLAGGCLKHQGASRRCWRWVLAAGGL